MFSSNIQLAIKKSTFWAVLSMAAALGVTSEVKAQGSITVRGVEVQDYDPEGAPSDLPGYPLSPLSNNPFQPEPIRATLGTLTASGFGGGNFAYLGQTTEQANRRSDAGFFPPDHFELHESFHLPRYYQGRRVRSAELEYDFTFLTDDLGDFGWKESDLEDDDTFKVTLNQSVILHMDSDQIFTMSGTILGLAPPGVESDGRGEGTGFEYRTGNPLRPWLVHAYDVTSLIGQHIHLDFDLVDPFYFISDGESLESGMMIDEIRLNLELGASIVSDYDGNGIVDGKDFLALQRGVEEGEYDLEALRAWQETYGQSTSGGQSGGIRAVPEPTALSLLISGLLLGLGHRRR